MSIVEENVQSGAIRGFLERYSGSEIHKVQAHLGRRADPPQRSDFSIVAGQGRRQSPRYRLWFRRYGNKIAQRVVPKGKVVGLDCCEAFLEYGSKEAAKLGCKIFHSSMVTRCWTTLSPSMISSFHASERCFSPIRWRDCENAKGTEAGRDHDAHCLAHTRG